MRAPPPGCAQQPAVAVEHRQRHGRVPEGEQRARHPRRGRAFQAFDQQRRPAFGLVQRRDPTRAGPPAYSQSSICGPRSRQSRYQAPGGRPRAVQSGGRRSGRSVAPAHARRIDGHQPQRDLLGHRVRWARARRTGIHFVVCSVAGCGCVRMRRRRCRNPPAAPARAYLQGQDGAWRRSGMQSAVSGILQSDPAWPGIVCRSAAFSTPGPYGHHGQVFRFSTRSPRVTEVPA